MMYHDTTENRCLLMEVQTPSDLNYFFPVYAATSWNYIEQMLATLLRNEQINHQDYRVGDSCNPYMPL